VVSTVWPEATSSAAGVRTMQLIQGFQKWWPGSKIHVTSTSAPNRHCTVLERSGVTCSQITLNRNLSIQELVTDCRPDVVVFDRFLAEEQFSHGIKSHWPKALTILDTQDIHSWRRARKACIKQGGSVSASFNTRPLLTQPDFLRELASIHRTDLSLLVGSSEKDLLIEHGVPSSKLAMAPFFYQQIEAQKFQNFGNRRDFVSIGNFMHEPNLDSLMWLIDSGLWRDILTRVPDAEIHIYGAYAPTAFIQKVKNIKGIVFKGFTEDLNILERYRVLLAPLRYGAGVKGKIVDAWRYGTPVVTTPIGSENMTDPISNEWGGSWSGTTKEELCNAAVNLYTDESLWISAQASGCKLANDYFCNPDILNRLKFKVEDHIENLDSFRSADAFQSILWHQTNRSTEYFSRWIELKETSN